MVGYSPIVNHRASDQDHPLFPSHLASWPCLGPLACLRGGARGCVLGGRRGGGGWGCLSVGRGGGRLGGRAADCINPAQIPGPTRGRVAIPSTARHRRCTNIREMLSVTNPGIGTAFA